MLRRDVFADHWVYAQECHVFDDRMVYAVTESSPNPKGSPVHLNESREVKATLTAASGRVIAWSTDKEPGHISLAVPGDRAKLTPVQAREFATWLLARADEVASAPSAVRMRDRYTMR